MNSVVLGPHPNNDVDPADPGPSRWQRIPADHDILARDVLQPGGRFAEEMMMVGRVRIEVRAARLDHDFAQQPGLGELMQGIVDSRERHPDRRTQRFTVQLLGGDMAVPVIEKEPRQGDALPRGSQTGGAQSLHSSRYDQVYHRLANIITSSRKINNSVVLDAPVQSPVCKRPTSSR